MNEKLNLRPELAEFANAMEIVLRANDQPPPWTRQPNMYASAWLSSHQLLLSRLQREVADLTLALFNCNPDETRKECVDVANFAMMIHDRNQQED